MPLFDHFVPPLARTHPWRGFHSAWAAAIARHLNGGVLPSGYYAIPNVELDGPVEIDVAALRERQQEAGLSAPEPAPLWSPSQPPLTVALDFPPMELVEVQVFWDEGDPQLKAAVELVSQRNKDRPDARRVFAVKCLSYLHAGSNVAVVDVVTSLVGGQTSTPRSCACWSLTVRPHGSRRVSYTLLPTRRLQSNRDGCCVPGRRHLHWAARCRARRSGWGRIFASHWTLKPLIK